MDKENLRNINALNNNKGKARVMLMRDFDPQGKGEEVPDPYYGADDGFVEVFTMLERSCKKLLDEINS
jgi:protein-tyrosine phosphatase